MLNEIDFLSFVAGGIIVPVVLFCLYSVLNFLRMAFRRWPEKTLMIDLLGARVKFFRCGADPNIYYRAPGDGLFSFYPAAQNPCGANLYRIGTYRTFILFRGSEKSVEHNLNQDTVIHDIH